MLRRILLFPYQLCLALSFLVLTAAWGIGCYVSSFFADGEARAHKCLTYWAKICLGLARAKVSVSGLERLEPNKTYIFMPNHASFLDILLVFAFIPYDFRIIVKKEIFSTPFLGWAVRASGQIPLDRENPRRGLRSIKQAAELIKRGISIVVFPEGTRSRDGKVHDFKATLFVLPIRTRTPVVPVYIEGTFEALGPGRVLFNPRPMALTFLAPVYGDFRSDKDRVAYAEKVRSALIENGQRPAPKAQVA
ncbi:MAG TPA: lysophospholipid acyltransferase family protein [Candidatus Acidoferrales bacterium]|nr:lysophospholipid acyltransferase family protein [Candidatus Acidoferrales bacterium]